MQVCTRRNKSYTNKQAPQQIIRSFWNALHRTAAFVSYGPMPRGHRALPANALFLGQTMLHDHQPPPSPVTRTCGNDDEPRNRFNLFPREGRRGNGCRILFKNGFTFPNLKADGIFHCVHIVLHQKLGHMHRDPDTAYEPPFLSLLLPILRTRGVTTNLLWLFFLRVL